MREALSSCASPRLLYTILTNGPVYIRYRLLPSPLALHNRLTYIVTAANTRQSFVKGERVSIPPPPTIADGLRVQSPGTLTFPILQKTAEDVLTVSDEEIIETIKFFLFRMKLLVEPSGAAAAAAVLTGKLPPDIKRVGVVVSGGNIDAELLSQFLAAQG